MLSKLWHQVLLPYNNMYADLTLYMTLTEAGTLTTLTQWFALTQLKNLFELLRCAFHFYGIVKLWKLPHPNNAKKSILPDQSFKSMEDSFFFKKEFFAQNTLKARRRPSDAIELN